MGVGPGRRSLLVGGASLIAAAAPARSAAAQNVADYAVFTELSPEPELMKGGWNRRLSTNLRVFVGNSKWHAFARISVRRIG